MPGVAELLKLYTEHAALVAKANSYLQSRQPVIVFTSSDATT